MGQHSEVTILIRAKDYASGVFKSLSSGTRQLKQAFFSLQGQMVAFGTAFATLGLAKYLIDVNREYGKLMTQLQTFEGSREQAVGVFKELAHFAAVTPFQIGEVTQAYITLKSAGITPSLETMRLFGDQAAAFGGKINDFANAVRAATTGEMRDMRQFGVVMMQQGDQIHASFHGHSQVIGRDAASIVKYLEDLSKKNFAGGMERQSKTLDGAISNLMDAFESLARAVGDAGFTDAVVNITRKLTEWTDSITHNDGAIRAWVGYIVDTFKVAGKSFAEIGAWMDSVRLRWAIFNHDLTDVSGLKELYAQLQEANKALDMAKADRQASIDARGTNFDQNKLGTPAQQRLRLYEQMVANDQPLSRQQQEDYLKLTGGPTSGMVKTTTASHESIGKTPHEKKEKTNAQLLAEDVSKQMEEAMANAEIAAEANRINSETAKDVLGAEESINIALKHGNLDREDRIKLEKLLYETQKKRKDLDILTVDERALKIMKEQNDEFEKHRAEDLRANNDWSISHILHNKDAHGNDTGVFDDKGRLRTESHLKNISNALSDAIGAGQTLNQVIADMTTNTFQAFGSAVESAFAAFVEGSASAGRAFAGAMLGALGAVASGFGQFSMARATGELAAGLGDLSNPITAPLAAGHFASASEWTAGAFAMFALAGVLSGAGNKVAGGGHASSASKTNNALSDQKGNAEIIIQGGLLDMSDPRTEQSFAKAIESLTGRRVNVRKA